MDLSDADDYYSDDDFTRTSQDERCGLSSICEEPVDSNDSSFPKRSIINETSHLDEHKCNESYDSYSLDEDFASILSRDKEPSTTPRNAAVSTDCECDDDTKIFSEEKHVPAEKNHTEQCENDSESQDSRSLDKPTTPNHSTSIDDGDCNEETRSDENYIGEVQVLESDVAAESTILETLATNDCKEAANDSNKENEVDAASNKMLPQQSVGKEGHTNSRCKPKIKKPAPLPRCATLSTKFMSIARKTNETNIDGKTQIKRKYSLKRLQELSKPRKHHMYARNDITREIKQTKKADSNSFLERMELMETERRAKAEFVAAEAKYNSKVDIDKLRCPTCGRIQSYSEFIGKSLNCKTDKCSKKKVQYQKKTQVNTFLTRLERSTQRRSSKVDEIRAERRSSLSSQCKGKSRTQKALMKKVATEGFMDRMQKDIHVRQTKISRHVELMDESLRKAHSFKPDIKIPDYLISNRKGGIVSLSAPPRRYTQSFEERLEECDRKQGNGATQKNTKSRAPIECLWSKKKYDEGKTKKRFQEAYI
ncbi:hypothetical protein ACHAWO_006719 [Cyclotella atomus]|uniref:Uncharacterized protein n=1 Tax=Cyclotella atomus TaxID=382360 RepID=A0ABD3MSD5_9STRA